MTISQKKKLLLILGFASEMRDSFPIMVPALSKTLRERGTQCERAAVFREVAMKKQRFLENLMKKKYSLLSPFIEERTLCFNN